MFHLVDTEIQSLLLINGCNSFLMDYLYGSWNIMWGDRVRGGWGIWVFLVDIALLVLILIVSLWVLRLLVLILFKGWVFGGYYGI